MDSRNTTFFSSVGTTLRRQGNREVRMSTVIAMGFGDHWSENDWFGSAGISNGNYSPGANLKGASTARMRAGEAGG